MQQDAQFEPFLKFIGQIFLFFILVITHFLERPEVLYETIMILSLST